MTLAISVALCLSTLLLTKMSDYVPFKYQISGLTITLVFCVVYSMFKYFTKWETGLALASGVTVQHLSDQYIEEQEKLETATQLTLILLSKLCGLLLLREFSNNPRFFRLSQLLRNNHDFLNLLHWSRSQMRCFGR